MSTYFKFQPGYKDRLLFVHIPKCGGISLRQSLFDIFEEDRVLRVYNSKISSDISLQRFSELSVDEILGYSCISGHLSYQNAKEKLGDNIEKFFVCALVREPVERIISYWNYVNTNSKHPLHQKALQMSFQEFVEKTPINNEQCKFISGRADAEYTLNTVSQNYDLVLPLKQYDQFLKIISNVFQHDYQKYEAQNKSKKFMVKKNVEENIISLIESINHEDKVFYEQLIRNMDLTILEEKQ